MSALTIVVNAHNRPGSLVRLLGSLARAQVDPGTRLAISIDPGGDPKVLQAAELFTWPFGAKEVIDVERKLGLVGHFLRCGDLTESYGDIIYLEDDLYLSPQFYRFSRQALEFYRSDPRVAGISLNHLHFNGYTHNPFWPLPDRGDTYFMQVYWYQGQVYSPSMWRMFRHWWDQSDRTVRPSDGLHPLFLPGPHWRDDFFPPAMKYLQETDRFFVFPRQAYSTNFGDPGTHFRQRTTLFQTPLQVHQKDLDFLELDDSASVYDGYYELVPDRLSAIIEGPFDVDLNGTRPLSSRKTDRILTTCRVNNSSRSWGLSLRPPELNVLEGIDGSGIALANWQDLRLGRMDRFLNARDRSDYFLPYRQPLSRRLLYSLSRLIFK